MKTKTIIVALMFLATGLSAQDKGTDKENFKSNREMRKAQREAEIQAAFDSTSQLIDSMQFVLEADYLANQYGYRIPVNSNLNFIMVNSKKAVLQTGNNSGFGYNGVGGVTTEGQISNLRVFKNPKRKTFNLSWDVNTPLGTYSIFMDASASGRASATLSGLWPGKLTYDGYIVPLEQTRTFKAMNTY